MAGKSKKGAGAKPIIKPTITPTERHFPSLSPLIEFQPRLGEYHVVALDIHGNEIAGSDFSASQSLVNKHYGNSPKFKVKKKPR